jgi:hypothetical protein
VKLEIEAIVVLRDKNGKILKTIRKKCHSYVRAMIDLLQYSMSDVAVYNYFSVIAAAGDNSYGIQVGTGTATVTILDAHLQTLIANGNAATQLSYGSVSVGAVAIVGSTAKFTIARTLTNNSGADITVNETGLMVNVSIGGPVKNLVEHTLLTFTITNGVSGTVTYTISVTV